MGVDLRGRRQVVRWTAGFVAAISLILLLAIVGAVLLGEEQPEQILWWLGVLGVIAAVAYLPLMLPEPALRAACGLSGLLLLVVGVFGLLLIVGVVLIPPGFIYLAVAFAPGGWSTRRTLGLALGVPLAILAVTGLVTGVGSLIEAGQR